MSLPVFVLMFPSQTFSSSKKAMTSTSCMVTCSHAQTSAARGLPALRIHEFSETCYFLRSGLYSHCIFPYRETERSRTVVISLLSKCLGVARDQKTSLLCQHSSLLLKPVQVLYALWEVGIFTCHRIQFDCKTILDLFLQFFYYYYCINNHNIVIFCYFIFIENNKDANNTEQTQYKKQIKLTVLYFFSFYIHLTEGFIRKDIIQKSNNQI